MSQDSDKLLFALLNFGIALCRLNSMGGAVIYRVRSESAFYIGAAFASAFPPPVGRVAALGLAGDGSGTPAQSAVQRSRLAQRQAVGHSH